LAIDLLPSGSWPRWAVGNPEFTPDTQQPSSIRFSRGIAAN
jgi:hypothetical protein